MSNPREEIVKNPLFRTIVADLGELLPANDRAIFAMIIDLIVAGKGVNKASDTLLDKFGLTHAEAVAAYDRIMARIDIELYGSTFDRPPRRERN
jgi:hypothetical protein